MSQSDILTFSIIILIFIVMLLFLPKLFKTSIEVSKAKKAATVKATVKRMAPAPIAGSTEVLFELSDGNRVVLYVGNPTFVVGETGMLKYYGKQFDSFYRTDT